MKISSLTGKDEEEKFNETHSKKWNRKFHLAPIPKKLKLFAIYTISAFSNSCKYCLIATSVLMNISVWCVFLSQ
jgi:hypothetical protein